MTNKNNPVGRPKGSFQYEEAKIHRTHYMTPKAHAWILGNKPWIEETTRWAPENPLPCQEKLRLKDLAVYGLTCLDLAKIEEFLGPLCVDDLPKALLQKVLDENEYLEECERRAEEAEDRIEELEEALEGLPEFRDRMKDAEDRVEELEQELDSVRADLSNTENRVAELLEALEDAHIEIDKLEAALREADA